MEECYLSCVHFFNFTVWRWQSQYKRYAEVGKGRITWLMFLYLMMVCCVCVCVYIIYIFWIMFCCFFSRSQLHRHGQLKTSSPLLNQAVVHLRYLTLIYRYLVFVAPYPCLCFSLCFQEGMYLNLEEDKNDSWDGSSLMYRNSTNTMLHSK